MRRATLALFPLLLIASAARSANSRQARIADSVMPPICIRAEPPISFPIRSWSAHFVARLVKDEA